ncbi:MAG: type VII secretion protein EccB [Catenulispora sp. 13_1_20CM_3_70_7]|nr:MAG: type VII secretion protein EccB [Catenulispora sp. 13_1_20CM_3_70_7]
MAVQNRRDQVLAYRFGLRRRHAALLAGDPDSPEAPLRKLGTATFGSIMAATLIAAVAGVMGVLSPGHDSSWKSPNVIIVEKETGSRFIYDPNPAPAGSPPALHPVLNYTSARLLLKDSGWRSVSVSRKSLAGFPRAAEVGIVGAPDELPGPGGVTPGPWTVCALPGLDAKGAPRSLTQLLVGPAPAGAAAPVGQQALVVQVPGAKGYWLIWNGHRFQIGDPASPAPADDPATVLSALTYQTNEALPVSAGWLNALPTGTPLRLPRLPDGPVPPEMTVGGKVAAPGQLFVVQARNGVPDRWFVATSKGFVELNQVQFELLGLQHGAPTTQAYADDMNRKVGDSALISTGDGTWPTRSPTIANSSTSGPQAVCAATTPGQPGIVVSTRPADPAQSASCYRLPPPAPAVAGADCVSLAPGTVAVARTRANAGVAAPAYLVTGNGEYVAKDSLGADPAGTLKALGLDTAAVAEVPQPLLALLPDGPTLSPEAARLAVVPPPPGPSPTAASAG